MNTIFPIFHVAIPLLLFEIPQIKKRFQFNRLALIIGSLTPDIIDKSLMLLNISPGRGISHTLIFAIISFLVVYVITKRKLVISLSYFTGILFHLILDLPDIPLFYPFISYQFDYLEDPFGSWFHELLFNPFTLISEIIGLIILLFIIIINRIYSFNKLYDFLFRTSQVKLNDIKMNKD